MYLFPYLFVCFEVLWPSQPNGVMWSTVSLPNHTFTGQAYSYKLLTSIVHILSPETDNCPSWISGRERMTVENISWSISMKECCWPRRGLNPRPPGLQSDGASNWATEAGLCFLIHMHNVFLIHMHNVFLIHMHNVHNEHYVCDLPTCFWSVTVTSNMWKADSANLCQQCRDILTKWWKSLTDFCQTWQCLWEELYS